MSAYEWAGRKRMLDKTHLEKAAAISNELIERAKAAVERLAAIDENGTGDDALADQTQTEG